MCRQLRQVAHRAVPGVEERIQYGKPHFLNNGQYVAVITAAKEHVSFTIFNAQDIDAPAGLFEPGKPERKTVKIRQGQAVDFDLLTRLLTQAADTLHAERG